MSEASNIRASSKMTSGFRVTIPPAIRAILRLEQGDTITFMVVKNQVVMHRESPLDKDYLDAVSATLNEWNSAEDDKAYGDL